MAAYPNTGSILNSKIHTALSTQIIIMCEGNSIGAIKSFSENQSRSNTRITEVGTDGTIEIVPTAPVDISLDLDRTVFDGLSLPEAFARGFRNIQSQRIPFDIVVIDQFSGTGDDAVITTYHNCWFKSLSKSYSSDDYVIVERASVDVESISTIRGGEAVAKSQGVGGGRQIANVQFDDIETQADSGLRLGGLDFGGLINAAY